MGVPAQSVQRQAWTTEDGLPQNSVHDLVQAKDGRLWLATEMGAARFDGIRFDRFNSENSPAFASNDLCCVVEAGDGSILFGTSDGVVRYSGGRFQRIDGPVGVTQTLLREAGGAVYVLTADALWQVEAGHGSPVDLPGKLQPSALGSDEKGRVLVVAGTVLFRHTGNTWNRERTLPVSPLDLFADENALWLRTNSEIVAVSSRGEMHWQVGKDLPGTRLESLLRTSQGVLAATNRGSFTLTFEKRSVAPIGPLDGMSVLSALTDREGDQWFGTDTSGLVVLRPRAIGSIPELAGETITCVVEAADGTVWLGTRDGGLRTVRDGIVVTPAASGKLASQVVLSLAPDPRGGVWVGTPEGLDHVAGTEIRHIGAADGLPDDFVRSLLAEENGTLWVGTRRGVAEWRDGRVIRLLTQAEGLPSDVIGSMLRSSNGDLWIGTLKGLERLPAGTSRVVAAQGVLGKAITGLAETPDGAIWVSSRDGGLGLYKAGSFSAVPIAGVTQPIQAILPDMEGRLWLRTGGGLYQAPVTRLEECAKHQACSAGLRQYGTADGLSSVDSSSDGHPGAWRTRSGVLWFASRRGVSSVDAIHLPTDRVPPSVTIDQVLVDGVAVPFQSGLRLSAGGRRLQVTYAGLSLRAPMQVRYRFRLEGFDHDWTDAGTLRVAEYTNLPPGRYLLQVEARNADGIASEQPALLPVRVDPPLYRTWWFYLLMLSLIAAIVYAVYWLRVRRIRREFAAVLGERNRIAREIHDTLAQDFVAVSLQLDVTSHLLKGDKVQQAREQIHATRQLVQDGIRDARESIWALRAGTNSDGLPARLQAMVSSAQETAVHAEFSVTGTYHVLAPSVEKEVLRIAKEAFGNAIRHAQAGTVRVCLVYSDEAILLQVSDDGQGFKLAEGFARTGHYGLRGMQERAAGMRGTLSVDSNPGTGTVVELRLPKA